MSSYKCDRCNKVFNYKNDFRRHRNRKFPCKVVNVENYTSDMLLADEIKIGKKLHTNAHKCTELHTNTQKFICNYCTKVFTRNSSLVRHIDNYCKARKDAEKQKEDIFNKLVEQMERQNEVIEQMQKQILDIQKENKELKRKLVINNTVNNTKNKNCNNTQINNNIQLVAFGEEDLLQISDDVSKIILNKGFMSVPRLVEHVHFNKNMPDNHNVYIPNMKSRYAMTFNGCKWNLLSKQQIIEQLFDDKNIFLEDKYKELQDALSSTTKKKFTRYVENYCEKEIKKNILDEIKLILYNNKNIPIETRKRIKNS